MAAIPTGRGTATSRFGVSRRDVFDVVDMTSPSDCARLAAYATGGHEQPLSGFWT